jgi:sodium-dependent dicarboxylate transporter 2/3/5
MRFSLRKTAHYVTKGLYLPNLIGGDSRLAAMLVYGGKRISNLGRAGRFLATLALAGLSTYFLSQEGFSTSQLYILFLTFTAIGLWLTEAIPPFAVGILIIGFLVFTQGGLGADGAEVQRYVNTWSSPVIWLMLGGFFLAEGLRKTQLDQALFRFTLKITGTQPKRILLGLMFTTALASMIMSNTATAAMMLASVMPLIKKMGKEKPLSKALLLGIPGAASVGGMGTIIGSPPNAIAVGALQGIGIEIDFLTWMAYGAPLALLLTAVFYVLLSRKKNFALEADLSLLMQKTKARPEDLKQQRIVLAVTGLTVGLWITTPLHHIPVAVISGIPIVLLTMLSIIYAQDVRALPWDTLMLVAGGLALGLALVNSGLAVYFIESINLQGAYWLLALAFALITVVASNIMSNTATASILIPLGLILMEGNPQGAMIIAMATALAASCALFLPVSTPPNAIAFSTGLVEQKDFRKGGVFIGLIGPFLALAWCLVVYAWFA